MKNTMKHRWNQVVGGIAIAAVALLSGCATVPAPTEQLAVAKVAVSNAAAAGGNEYASVDMRAAQDKLERAVQAMTDEDFKNATVLAEQAEVDARLAIAKVRAAKAQQAAAAVQEDNSVLRKEIDRNRP